MMISCLNRWQQQQENRFLIGFIFREEDEINEKKNKHTNFVWRSAVRCHYDENDILIFFV